MKKKEINEKERKKKIKKIKKIDFRKSHKKKIKRRWQKMTYSC